VGEEGKGYASPQFHAPLFSRLVKGGIEARSPLFPVVQFRELELCGFEELTSKVA